MMVAIAAAYVERQAGYDERAVAIVHSLLEANFNVPNAIKHDTPRETFLNFFQAFWDAEVPRVGEEGAEGWNAWHTATYATAMDKRAKVVADYDPTAGTEEMEAENAMKVEVGSVVGSVGAMDTMDTDEAVKADAEEDKHSAEVIDPEASEKVKLREWINRERESDRQGLLPARGADESVVRDSLVCDSYF